MKYQICKPTNLFFSKGNWDVGNYLILTTRKGYYWFEKSEPLSRSNIKNFIEKANTQLFPSFHNYHSWPKEYLITLAEFNTFEDLLTNYPELIL